MNAEHNIVPAPVELIAKKKEKYILEGPNGIGKTTLLKRLVSDDNDGATIHD
jgi:ABC-type molybdenum transport system ATPase subunit/photorepair protein PhrA